MPAFDTAGPISATIDVVVGDVRISAGDGAAAVIDVRPSDSSNDEDVKVAEQTRVEFVNEHLLVKTPKVRSWRQRSTGGSVDVTIELPAGSQLRATGQMTDLSCAGRLGDSRIRTVMGQITLDEVDTPKLKTGIGIEQARTGMEAIARRLASVYPESNKGWGIAVDRLSDVLISPGLRNAVSVLFAATM